MSRVCEGGLGCVVYVAAEDDSKKKSMKHVRFDVLDQEGGPIFAGLRPETPWESFDYWALAPGEERSVAGTGMACEQGYVFTGGPVELTVRQHQIKSGEGPGFIVEPTGCHHALKNLTDMPVQVLRVRVAIDVDSDAKQGVQPNAGAFDAQALTWRDAIHGGCGQIATRHVLSPEDFYSDWTFLDHAILDAGGSVGYHYHDFLEESFVVLRGQGLMTIADETFAVKSGSVTWQGIGQGHGIYNPGPEKLEFVRIAVKQADEEYTTIDLHNDLSARRPT